MSIVNTFHKVIKNENQISQLLVNLVNKYPDIKKIVQIFFFQSENFIIDSFSTQKRDKNGQPDIHFYFRNKENEFIGEAIIEVKTQDSELTPNQPEGYVKKLLEGQALNKYLFFLIPKYYDHEEEIKERFKKIVENNQIYFCIKNWDQLIKELLPKEKYNSDLLNELIDYFEQKFCIIKIDFKKEELKLMNSPEIPNTIIKLNKLVDSIANALGYKNIKWQCNWDEGYGDGYGFWYEKHDMHLWIGYDYKIWSETGCAFILLTNKRVNSKAFSEFDIFFNSKGEKPLIYKDDNDIKFINISNKVGENENTPTITNLISEFVKLIK